VPFEKRTTFLKESGQPVIDHPVVSRQVTESATPHALLKTLSFFEKTKKPYFCFFNEVKDCNHGSLSCSGSRLQWDQPKPVSV